MIFAGKVCAFTLSRHFKLSAERLPLLDLGRIKYSVVYLFLIHYVAVNVSMSFQSVCYVNDDKYAKPSWQQNFCDFVYQRCVWCTCLFSIKLKLSKLKHKMPQLDEKPRVLLEEFRVKVIYFKHRVIHERTSAWP